MRKTFTILILLAIGVQLMAQTGFSPAKRKLDRLQKNDVIHYQNVVKSPGDVIWTEDFDGADWSGTSLDGEPVPENAPIGWVLGDLTGVDHYFRWDTVGPRGYYTNPYGPDSCFVPQEPVFTTTQSNGYMMMEGDWYHTGADCGIIYMSEMDGYVEYQTGIDFSDYNAVHLTFEQAARFCCTNISDGRPFFKVSTDNGITWNSISLLEADVNNQIGEFGGPAYTSEFDVSNYVAGESDVWFRFQLTDLSHYFWIIDDIAFVEPVANDMKFTDYWNDYIHYRDDSEVFPLNSTHDFTEGFYEYPWFLVQEYKGFHAAYENFGGQEQTNFVHNVGIWKNGNVIEAFASDAIANLPTGTHDTSMIQATSWPWGIGEYTFMHYPSTDVPDENTSNDTLYCYMKVGDSTVRVVDFTKVNSSISPDNWESFDEDGDGLGFLVNLPHPSLHDLDGNADYYILDGASLYVASNNKDEEIALFENGEARVVAGMYKYDFITDTYTEQISSAEYTLSINDTNSVVYIPFAQDGTSEYVFEGGTFLVAFNMYGIWNRPEDGNLQSWNIWSADNTVQKNSREACLTVNASITDTSDVSWTTGEGPAFGLRLEYTEWGPQPDPYYATFIVKNTLGEFVEGAKVVIDEYNSKYTDSFGMAKFPIYTCGWFPFDYIVSYEGYDTVTGTSLIEYSNITINITMNPVGIFNAESSKISVYPNPSNGIFTVDGEGEYSVQIINMSGKIVSEFSIFEKSKVDLSNNPQGMYVIKVSQNSQSITKRIIVQ